MSAKRVKSTKPVTGESLNAAPIEGWTPPRTKVEVTKRFFKKHGDNVETRAIDRKWRIIGSKV